MTVYQSFVVNIAGLQGEDGDGGQESDGQEDGDGGQEDGGE